MPHVIGMAGHIDHGKTALIRALTGQDTDRLKEEKERGISIDLGFAYLDLDSGERAGIVDVPGHERFIRNMLAGVHGIDLVLLVVAADDGVMPQTEEHLDILHLLGARHGVVALTKIDLVDAERVAAAREEIEVLLAGTGLEGAAIVPVSSVTGEGLDALRLEIGAKLSTYQRSVPLGYFRMPIDRAFVIHGHGTVVTGTAIAGHVRPSDTVRLLPSGDEARVRTVQVHGGEVSEAGFGQRVALNLAGIERSDAGRGHVVCDPRLDRTSDRFDALMEIRPAAGSDVTSHSQVHVHCGTAEAMGKIIVLGAKSIERRQSAYAQIVLREPIHVLRGDRFVLRNASAQRTIGGGVVLHPFARRHATGETGLLDHLAALRESAGASRALRALMELETDFVVSIEWLAQAAGLAVDETLRCLRDDPTARLLPTASAAEACTTTAKWDALSRRITGALAEHHRSAPLVPGLEMESLRQQVVPDLTAKLFRVVADALLAEKDIARDASLLRLPSHRVNLGKDEVDLAERAATLLAAAGLTPPDVREIETTLKVPGQRLRQVLQQLEREGRVAKVAEGMYFASPPLETARQRLRQHLTQHGDITAAAFRDLLGASRKFSIALLDYFDRTGFTLRVGDVRKLRRP